MELGQKKEEVKCNNMIKQHKNNQDATGEEILPNDQNRMIEQAKFTYSPLSKRFEKQIKTLKTKEKIK